MFSWYKYLIISLVCTFLEMTHEKKVQVCKDQEKAQSERDSHSKKVQVGKDQEKAQSERDSHSKHRGGKKQTNNQALIQ